MKKAIVFTDAGIDDAIALSSALKSNQLNIQAIYVSGGNVTPDQGVKNIDFILNIAGIKDKPLIIKGRSNPISGKFPPISYIHGSDGLGNVTNNIKYKKFLTKPEISPPQEFYKLLDKTDEKVIIITLSPLTDLAFLLTKYFKLMDKIEEIIIMGGGILGKGNITACAEFNFFCDPKAADIVLKSNMPIVLVPLDVSEKIILEEKHLKQIISKGHLFNQALGEMLSYYFNFHLKNEFLNGCYVHDPLAIILSTNRNLITDSKSLPLVVETREGITYGEVVADLRKKAKEINSNIEVVFGIKEALFKDQLISSLCI